jgi:ACS family glucarate transporter-like MFS transporter
MNQRPTNIRWRIFLVLALASFVSYVLRSNVSIAAPAMIEDLGLTEIQWGWVLAAFTAGYAIFQFPGGMFGDKVGARKALMIIAVLWSVFMILTVVIPGPDVASAGVVIGSLMAVRFLVGAAHAPIFPVMNTAINRWFPAGGYALPLGLSSTALTLGFAAVAPVLAWVSVEYGWRVSFLLLSPLGFIVAALWWWYARDNPSEHHSVNEAELALVTAEVPPAALAPINPPGWIRVLKNRNILLLTLSYSCMNFVFYEVFNWFYYYLVEVRNFDPGDAGFVTSTQWMAGAAGAALGGWLCDRLCKKLGLRWGCRWPIIIGLLASAALLVGGAFHSNPTIAVTMLAVCFFFNQLTEGTYWATSISVGGELAGAAGGVMNTGANAMGVLNALLVPWFAHTVGWDVALASGAGFAVVGAILLLFIRADEPIDLE